MAAAIRHVKTAQGSLHKNTRKYLSEIRHEKASMF